MYFGITKSFIIELFTLNNLIAYFKLFLYITGALLIFNIVSMSGSYFVNIKKYENNLLHLEKNVHDPKLLCLSVGCEYIKYNNKLYFNNNDNLISINSDDRAFNIKYFNILNRDFNIVLKENHNEYIIDDNLYIELLRNTVYNSIFLSFIIVTIFFLYYTYESNRLEKIKHNLLKDKFETNVQRNMSESLNHEITLPLSIIKTYLNRLFYILINEAKCNKKKDLLKEKDDVMLAIENIENVINYMADTRHLKNRSKNINTCLLDIINVVINNVNSIKVKKAKLVIKEGEDLLKTYRADRNIGNGSVISIFKNHFINLKMN